MCLVMYQVPQLIIRHKIVCTMAKSMMTIFSLTPIEQPLNLQNCFVTFYLNDCHIVEGWHQNLKQIPC